jgi:hypothetical protein
MGWSYALMLSIFATLYVLLAQNADGMLAGFAYTSAALLFMLAMMFLMRPPK